MFKLKSRTERLKAYYEAHGTRVEAAFFLGGVLFDVLTLSEIDDRFALIQQAFYLAFCFWLFDLDLRNPQASPAVTWAEKYRARLWPYRHLVFHFCMGSLLSVYSIFFFISSATAGSWIVVALIATLLVGNELPLFKRAGLQARGVLLWVNLICFVSILWPIVLGWLGWVPFALTLLTLAGGLYLHRRSVLRRSLPVPFPLRTIAGTLAAFALLYVAGAIPPVPLSAKSLGVYHGLEKREGNYILTLERPWWKFWASDDADFRAAPGDRVFFFARIFAPTQFKDSVWAQWSHRERDGKFHQTDSIELKINGGRTEGYRGYAVKQNLAPGDWKVQLSTSDGRAIARTSFTITPDSRPPEERKFRTIQY